MNRLAELRERGLGGAERGARRLDLRVLREEQPADQSDGSVQTNVRPRIALSSAESSSTNQVTRLLRKLAVAVVHGEQRALGADAVVELRRERAQHPPVKELTV